MSDYTYDHFTEQKDQIIKKFRKTYRIALEWDKVVNSEDKLAKYILPEDLDEDLPQCLFKYRNIWMNKLKKREEAVNKQGKSPHYET